MPAANFEVVRVVGRSDFYDAGSESWVHILVRDDGNSDVRDWNHDVPSDQRLPPLVARMHGQSDIAEHGLGTCSSDRNVSGHRLTRVLWLFAGCGKRLLGRIRDGVEDTIQIACLFAVLRLFVAERRQTSWTPVNDAVTPINQAAFVKLDESLAHAARKRGRKRVRGAVPVGRGTDSAQLPQNLAAGLLDESDCPCNKCFSPQIRLGFSFCS